MSIFDSVPDDSGGIPTDKPIVKAPSVTREAKSALKKGTSIFDGLQSAKDIAKIYPEGELALHDASAIGLGFPAYMGGAVGGLIDKYILGEDVDPEKIAHTISQAVTYDPITDAGKRLMKTQNIPLDVMSREMHVAGRAVARKTDSPMLGAITESTGDVLSMAAAGKVADAGLSGFGAAKVATDAATKLHPKAVEAFDKLIQHDPQKAKAVADKVTDPEIKKELKEQIKQGEWKWPKGNDQKTDPKNITTVTVGRKTLTGKAAEEFLAKKANKTKAQQFFENVEDAKNATKYSNEEDLRDKINERVGELEKDDPELTGLFGPVGKEGQAAVAGETPLKGVLKDQRSQQVDAAQRQAEINKRGAQTPDQAKANLRNTVRAVGDVMDGPPKGAMAEAFVRASLKKQQGGVNMKPLVDSVEKAFNFAKDSNIVRIATKEISDSAEQLIRNIAPEALGPKAKTAAAVLAKAISEQMRDDSQVYHQGRARTEFWDRFKPDEQAGIIKQFERGATPKDPALAKAFEGMRQWNDRILDQDRKLGIDYEPKDNYLYHTFEDGDKVTQYFQNKYGTKWGNPKFTKDRSFDLYDEAVKAGFKPKTTNPEEIMQLRQHASNIAKMQVEAMEGLQRFGLATQITKGVKPGPGDVRRRAPNGKSYYINSDAAQIVHNAFDSPSLWDMKGVFGAGFRGTMYLKNALVPIKLAMSLFHPLHVQTIDNATSMVRASKELLSGSIGSKDWVKQMASAAIYRDVWNNPKTGYGVLKAWRGDIDPAKLTSADKQALNSMAEGGFTPEMASEYKNNAIDGFKKALQQHSVTAPFKAPFALIETMQKPLFDIWIPSLKIASYLKDTQAALRTNPDLGNNTQARMEAFRKISKSVDNRYGEMAYNTLFWNRTVKDVGVGSTLSLGWNLGFIREYGGAIGDVAKAVKGGSIREAAKQGTLDRPLFVMYYTAQSLLYGGLLTYGLTGKLPQTLMDYIYPQNGEKNADGSPARLSTMFYAREFASIGKHMQNDGVVSGLTDAVLNKASPVISDVREWATNTDYLGREISDPDAPWYTELQQKMAHELTGLAPISISAPERGGAQPTLRDRALGVLGFTPAPKYVTDSPTEAAIKKEFTEYVQHSKTPFANADRSADSAKLRRLYISGDTDAYAQQLVDMKEKYHLNAEETTRLRKNSKIPGDIKMWQALSADQQVKLLKKMPPEDQEKYLPHAHKKVKHTLAEEAQ